MKPIRDRLGAKRTHFDFHFISLRLVDDFKLSLRNGFARTLQTFEIQKSPSLSAEALLLASDGGSGANFGEPFQHHLVVVGLLIAQEP